MPPKKKKTNRYSEHPFADGWPSVTTITGMLDKPYLYGWYAKYGQEAHRINDHSKKIGALIDNEICFYFGDEGIKEIDRSVLEHTESKAYFEQAIQNFHTVMEELKVSSIVGQKVVYSKEHKYIGTFDRLIVVEGKLVLSDWKATNYVEYPYKMQLEAYYRALVEMIGHDDIPMNGYEWHEYPLWIVQFPKKEKINLEKHIHKFKPSERRWKNFLSLLDFYYGKIEDEKEN